MARWARRKKTGEKNHATKVTKTPKTKRWKYGMNETLVHRFLKFLQNHVTTFTSLINKHKREKISILLADTYLCNRGQIFHPTHLLKRYWVLNKTLQADTSLSKELLMTLTPCWFLKNQVGKSSWKNHVG